MWIFKFFFSKNPSTILKSDHDLGNKFCLKMGGCIAPNDLASGTGFVRRPRGRKVLF